MIYGIDVSSWNGFLNPKSVQPLSLGGIEFVIARSSLGLVRDAEFVRLVELCGGEGWLTAAYHFMQPGDPVGQARTFYESAGGGMDGYAVDLEVGGITGWDVARFVLEFERLSGRRLGLYSSDRYIEGRGFGHLLDLFSWQWWAEWQDPVWLGKLGTRTFDGTGHEVVQVGHVRFRPGLKVRTLDLNVSTLSPYQLARVMRG